MGLVKRRYRHRDSESGEFTTAAYADDHPGTTEREQLGPPKRGNQRRRRRDRELPPVKIPRERERLKRGR